MNGSQRLRAAVFSGVCLCLAGAVDAPGQGRKQRYKVRPPKDADLVIVDTFALIDANDDGTITHMEFYDHIKIFSFRRLDADGDGKISRKEWNAVETGKEGAEIFARRDTNSDGALSLREFKGTKRSKNVIENLFKTLDTNADNALALDEFDAKDE